MIASACTHLRARRSALAATAAAAALAATLIPTASASAAQLLVPRSAGLSGPTAAVQTPDGARWVADGMLGVCRVADGGASLVADLYCSDGEVEPHVGPIRARASRSTRRRPTSTRAICSPTPARSGACTGTQRPAASTARTGSSTSATTA